MGTHKLIGHMNMATVITPQRDSWGHTKSHKEHGYRNRVAQIETKSEVLKKVHFNMRTTRMENIRIF